MRTVFDQPLLSWGGRWDRLLRIAHQDLVVVVLDQGVGVGLGTLVLGTYTRVVRRKIVPKVPEAYE